MSYLTDLYCPECGESRTADQPCVHLPFGAASHPSELQCRAQRAREDRPTIPFRLDASCRSQLVAIASARETWIEPRLPAANNHVLNPSKAGDRNACPSDRTSVAGSLKVFHEFFLG
jgi:hypothetical protein